jgi:hypothetical protein
MKEPTRPASKIVIPPPPPPLKANQAAILLSKKPGVKDESSLQIFRDVPPVVDKNYSALMQLSRISRAAVPKPSSFFVKKPMTTGVTQEMVEDFKRKEKEGLLKSGIVHPDINLNIVDLPTRKDYEKQKLAEQYNIERQTLQRQDELTRNYAAAVRAVERIELESEDLSYKYDAYMARNPPSIAITQRYLKRQDELDEILRTIKMEMDAMKSETMSLEDLDRKSVV